MAMLLESRTLARGLGNHYGEATVEQNIVEVALAQGDLLTAAESTGASMRLASAMEAAGLVAATLEIAAGLALKVDDAPAAAFLLGAAARIRAEHSHYRLNADDTLEHTMELAAQELGEEAFDQHQAEGARAPAEVVDARALGVCERARALAARAAR
jgi:hypothetical protein